MISEKRKEILRVIKFVLFSVSAGIIEIVSFTLLPQLTDWQYWPRYLIALVLSVLWNFTLHRKFSFKSANTVPLAMMKILAFYCVFTPVTTILGNYLAENLGWNEYLVTGLNMLMNITTEYLYDRFVVFGKTIDTNDIAKKKAFKERK